MKTFCSLLILFTFFASCNEKQADPEAEKEKLMQLSREWSTAAAGGDMEKILSYWADDAVVMQPGQPIIRGKEQISAMVRSTSQIPGFRISWEPQEVHVSKSGDMAYMLEKNQISFTDPAGNLVTEHNKVTTVWRKQEDGTWKNVVDMWNADPAVELQE